MWILLRAPKMKGAILGFQNRVWWPKCTPAANMSRMLIFAMFPRHVWVEPPRIPDPNHLSMAPTGLCRCV